MGCVLYICPDCGYASGSLRLRPPRECPICGARLIEEFDEDGDHDEPERDEEDER
jgi:rubrerythrin